MPPQISAPRSGSSLPPELHFDLTAAGSFRIPRKTLTSFVVPSSSSQSTGSPPLSPASLPHICPAAKTLLRNHAPSPCYPSRSPHKHRASHRYRNPPRSRPTTNPFAPRFLRHPLL